MGSLREGIIYYIYSVVEYITTTELYTVNE